jgi:biopolymer transport protein ExbD
MPYTFDCPDCGNEQPVSDKLAGTEVRCTACGNTVIVPSRAQVAAKKNLAKSGSASATGVGASGGESSSYGASSTGGEGGAFVSFHDDDDREPAEAEMDMTPMVDVTFLLLIFFMVTAAFTMQKSMQIPKPEVSDVASTNSVDEEEDNESVTIHIDADNMYRVITPDDEFECPSVQEMHVRLREAMTASPQPERLIVRANRECTHERVVTALDAGADAKIDDIQLVTVDEDY